MDCKELIEQLRNTFSKDGCELERSICESAAALETLMAERDAAVEDLRGMCWCCVLGEKYENGLPWSNATTCEHMRELGAVARSGGKCRCAYWQWRGPQKEPAL